MSSPRLVAADKKTAKHFKNAALGLGRWISQCVAWHYHRKQEWFDRRWRQLKNIPALVKFIFYEPAIGPLRLPKQGPFPHWLISGGESGNGARPVNPQWIRDIVTDCRRNGVALFHKQWGSYRNNPLVLEQGISLEEAKRLDPFGKGGGSVDGKLVREFPVPKGC